MTECFPNDLTYQFPGVTLKMIPDVLCDVARGTLVTVWSMPLIFEGMDPIRKKYLFRYPFSLMCLDENEDEIKNAVEVVTKFETVKDSYLRMLSEEIFQGVLKDHRNATQETIQGFLCAFVQDLRTLTSQEIQKAVYEAQDRLESLQFQEAF